MRVQPRGYVGGRHETIGSDIIAVLHTVKFAEQVLGKEWMAKLSALKPDGWYPIGTLLDLLEFLEQKVGPASLQQMGRQLFRDSHQPRVKNVLKSAGDILYGFDAIYHHANRGDRIGGWKLMKFTPGIAVIDKTTPHHCALEEGIMHEALAMVQAASTIVQSKCMRRGADSCLFEVRSSVKDARWMGTHPTLGA